MPPAPRGESADAAAPSWYARGVRAVLLAALSGLLWFFGYIGIGIWPLVFVFLAVLLVAIEGARPRRAFLLGWWMGFVAMGGGYYWVVHLLTEFADLPLPLALLGNALLNLYQGLPWGIVAWLVARGRVDLSIHPSWSLPVAVIVVAWIYPLIFPSFIGATFFVVPILMQTADLGGPYLVDGLVALVNGGLYALLPSGPSGRARTLRPAVAAGVALVGALVYGGVRMAQVEAKAAEARTLTVALIQANLGAKDKTLRRQEFLEQHQRMSRDIIAQRPDVELIVWPEAAFNRAIHRRRTHVGADITVGVDRPVLSGSITVDQEGGERFVYNSAILTSSTGEIRGVFDKVNLVYFGETIPLVDTFPSIKEYFPRTGSFDRGKTFLHLKLEDGTALLPMICYEDLIPSFVRDMWKAAGPPEALVNVTNDSWYGDTFEPLIHLALSTLRSVETRRSLIRSTNTGISAIVHPTGRIQARTGQWTRETLVAEVPLIEDESATVYVRFGDWLPALSALGVIGGFVAAWRRRRRGRR